MSQPTSASAHSSLPLQSGSSDSILRAGGALGIAGSLIGVTIFVAACAGFDAAFYFSMIPLGMGIVGIILVAIGAIKSHGAIGEPPVLAGIFINVMALVGGLLEIAVWLRWPVFFGQVA